MCGDNAVVDPACCLQAAAALPCPADIIPTAVVVGAGGSTGQA